MPDSPPPEYSLLPPSEDDQTPEDIGTEQESSTVQEASSSRLSVAHSTLLNSSTTEPNTAFPHYEAYQDIILRPDPSDMQALALPPTYIDMPQAKAYKIGSQKLSRSLVMMGDVKGHLALLHSFAELKKQVESAVIQGQYVPQDREMKWAWFVGLAVERFDTWCQALTPEAASEPTYVVLPPVDVIMVWHAYMLNPRSYGEDSVRIPACRTLATFERYFKQLLTDPWLVLTESSTERVNFWIASTRLGYDPLIEMHNVSKKIISCPRCNTPIEVDLANRAGTGYLQRKFTTTCTEGTCQFSPITMETLAIQKLVQDLVSKTDRHQASSYLAGTLFSQVSADKQKGVAMKQSIYERIERSSETSPLTRNIHGELEPYQLYPLVMKQCGYSMVVLRGIMGVPPFRTRIGTRISNAYCNDKIYSVDLVGAVLRQGSFVKKMYDLGWTAPTFFEDPSDGMALQHAIARYHAFLHIISLSSSFVVPTLDIDLVWHTHQLSPARYRHDCHKYVKRFVDHDDKVDGPKLSTAFENTCRIWKERYNIQYVHCGCPVEGKSIGERLLKMVGASTLATAGLEPIDRHDVLSSTHPSDHNAVRLIPKNGTFITNEKAKIEEQSRKRQKEMDKATKARESKGKSVAGSIPSSTYCTYNPAFLIPIPMHYGDTGNDNGQCMPDGHFVNTFGDLPGLDMGGCGVPGGAS